MKFMYSSFQCRLLSLVSFLTLGRTRKFIPPPWYKGGTPPYPDVSLSIKMCAQRKAGRRQRARGRFACRLHPSHGPSRFITNGSQLPCEKRSAWEGGWGGGGGWNPCPKFLSCCSISKRFYLWWKAFDLLNKIRYILWVVALLLSCDVTNNGCHLGRNLWFCQELEIRLKPREIVIFCALREK